MRTAYWDTSDPEMYFDNSNLIWTDPAYLLEPGDPGYVPPLPTVNPTKRKTKRMKHNKFWPRRQGDQIVWLRTFSDEVAKAATALGIVGAAAADPDLSAVQPPLSVNVTGSQVDLKSGWGGNVAYLDNIEIQKDWGDGKGFVLLTITASITFTDTAPQPATRTAWAYRCIYRLENRQVGIFSNPVSVGVGG